MYVSHKHRNLINHLFIKKKNRSMGVWIEE